MNNFKVLPEFSISFWFNLDKNIENTYFVYLISSANDKFIIGRLNNTESIMMYYNNTSEEFESNLIFYSLL